jgi:hypothetical protein
MRLLYYRPVINPQYQVIYYGFDVHVLVICEYDHCLQAVDIKLSMEA